MQHFRSGVIERTAKICLLPESFAQMNRYQGQASQSFGELACEQGFGTFCASLIAERMGDAMNRKRTQRPARPDQQPAKRREVELEMPVAPRDEAPRVRRSDDEAERGEVIIDLFGSDDTFTI